MSRPAKLPVWKTTGECYRLVFTHLGDFVRISWLWILVMVPVYAAMHSLIWYLTESPVKLTNDVIKASALLIPMIPESIFLASIAVAWHALILRGDKPVTANRLRIDRTVLNYAGWAWIIFILLFVLAGLPLGLIDWSPGQEPSESDAVVVASFSLCAVLWAFIGLTAWFMLTPRWSLKLPATALEQRLEVSTSWRLTKGNTWRLTWTSFLCAIPSLVASMAAVWYSFDVPANPDLGTYAISNTATSFAYAIPTIFGVTLFSLVYRHFVLTPHPLDSQGNLP
jgi:hypothetical protein